MMTRTSVGRPARGLSPGRRPTMSRASRTGTRGAQQRSASPHVDDSDSRFLMTPSHVASRRPRLTKLCGFAFWCGESKGDVTLRGWSTSVAGGHKSSPDATEKRRRRRHLRVLTSTRVVRSDESHNHIFSSRQARLAPVQPVDTTAVCTRDGAKTRPDRYHSTYS